MRAITHLSNAVILAVLVALAFTGGKTEATIIDDVEDGNLNGWTDSDGAGSNVALSVETAKVSTGAGAMHVSWWDTIPGGGTQWWDTITLTFSSAQNWTAFDTLQFDMAKNDGSTGTMYYRHVNNGVAQSLLSYSVGTSQNYQTYSLSLGSLPRDNVTAIQFTWYTGYIAEGSETWAETRNYFFDNIAVVPEPSSVALIAVGLAMTAGFKRRPSIR